MRLQIQLLGGFALKADDEQIPATIEARKAQELLSYLLVAREQWSCRDAAVEALWPEATPNQGRKQVRQALWHIHNALDVPAGSPRFVVAEGDHLSLNPERERWCDATEFVAGVERHLSTRSDPQPSTCLLDDTLAAYRGAFLDGCYSDWCLIERERIESLYLLALDLASEDAERRNDSWAGIRWCSALLVMDPAHERTHRRLMRLHQAMDDRSRALQQFDRCTEALKSELGVQPSARTVALAASIRDDRDLPLANAVGPVAEPTRGELLEELTALRTAVAELQQIVQAVTNL